MTNKLNIKIGVYGSTSSGKSTLINFFIGRELLPTSVQEMTTSITKIKHHSYNKKLLLDNSIQNPEKIKNQLKEIFTNTQKPKNKYNLELEWPTRFGKKINLTDIELMFIDYPGVRFIGDQKNEKILSGEEDILIFVLSANEIDIKKQIYVLDKIYSLKNKSNKKLFIIVNKCDVFSFDEDPIKSENKFIKKLKIAIDNNLGKEQTKNIYCISSEIAYYANVVLESKTFWEKLRSFSFFERQTQESIDCFQKLMDHYFYMIPSDFINSIPRNINHISKKNQKKLANIFLRKSRINQFELDLIFEIQNLQKNQ